MFFEEDLNNTIITLSLHYVYIFIDVFKKLIYSLYLAFQLLLTFLFIGSLCWRYVYPLFYYLHGPLHHFWHPQPTIVRFLKQFSIHQIFILPCQ